jgi:hypothetical protein
MCCGMWILDVAWLKDVVKKGVSAVSSTSELSRYEVAGSSRDASLGGPSRARKAMEEHGLISLFAGYEFVLLKRNYAQDGEREEEKSSALNESTIRWMISKCNGRVIRTIHGLDEVDRYHNHSNADSWEHPSSLSSAEVVNKPLIVSLDDRLRQEGAVAVAATGKQREQVLVLDWILDAISQQLIPTDIRKYYVS